VKACAGRWTFLATVERHRTCARAWLHAELADDGDEESMKKRTARGVSRPLVAL
jgi:hypothetical protein